MAIRAELTKNKQALKIIQRYELLDKIESFTGPYALRNKALVSFLYLTGCRVEEVCKFIKEKNLKRIRKNKVTKEISSAPILERQQIGEPLKKKQVEFRENNVIIHNVRCLKRRSVQIVRSIPVPKKEREHAFISFVLAYMLELQPEDYLFDLTRQRIYVILSGVGLYPHYLRHLRMSHLAVDYNFSSADLKQFTGWTTSKTADEYIHLNITDLVNKMAKAD